MLKAICAAVLALGGAVVLLEQVGVLDGLLLVAGAEAEEDRVLEGAVGLVRALVGARVSLVPLRRLVVDGDGLVVTADLEDCLLRERRSSPSCFAD